MKDFKLICVLTEDQVHPKLWSPGCPQPQNVCISELRAGSRTWEGASEPIATAFLRHSSVYSDNFPSVYVTTLISAWNYSRCVLLLLSAIPKDSIFFSKPQLHPTLFLFRGPHRLPHSCDVFPNIPQITSTSPHLCLCQFHLYMTLKKQFV